LQVREVLQMKEEFRELREALNLLDDFRSAKGAKHGSPEIVKMQAAQKKILGEIAKLQARRLISDRDREDIVREVSILTSGLGTSLDLVAIKRKVEKL